MTTVHEITAKSQLDMLMADNENKLIVIDFYATWCGPCKQVMPLLPQLAAKFADNVVFVKVDVDESDDMSEEYQVSAMPTFVFIKDGLKVDTYTGTEEDTITSLIEKYV